MHRLEKIVVRGFRGQAQAIDLELSPDANFLIGRNGTGKTTLINLIHAALSIDIPALKDSRFDRIEFIFKRHKSRIKPRLSVSRYFGEDGLSVIAYKVADNATATPDEYVFARQKRRPGFPDGYHHTYPRGNNRPISLKDRIGAIYQTTWLSLQRGADKIEDDTDWDTESQPGIDRKLNDLSNDLTRYFSRLDRQVSDQTQLFQKEWFLSFLANDKKIRERDVSRIDEAREREALTSIFHDFNMATETYTMQMDRHFRLAKRAKAAFKETNTIQIRDYLVAVDVLRLHSLVEQWQELENVKESIYEPKRMFESVATEMLFRKRVVTNNSNQVVVQSDIGEHITLDKLSSGEKQLLIFLSETLLQEQKPFIFMADEPELSMHVQWQEELVPALLRINPNAQVVFATHSPDIVSTYQNNVFKMEELTA